MSELILEIKKLKAKLYVEQQLKEQIQKDVEKLTKIIKEKDKIIERLMKDSEGA